MDFEQIKKAAEGYRADMTRFLRDMISHPSESCEEKEVVACIKAEMEKLGYDKVEVDGLGNVIGWMGEGDKIIAIDSHIDTVGIGNIDNWEADPYKGYEDDAVIFGRGGSDQEGGMASATYGAKIMKDLGLIPAGYKIMVVGSVQEEDCDGMCWQYIVNKFFPQSGIKKEQVEFVISTEPTDGGIYRGHRGRMEIRVDVKGVSCHGSAPERGDNAIYKMADILQDVRALNENDDADATEIKGLVKMLNPKYNPEHYEDARFLGRGTCTTSQIFYTSGRLLRHLHRPPHDRRRDLGLLPPGDPGPAQREEVRRRREGVHVHVRPSLLDRRGVRDRGLLPHLDQQGVRRPRPGSGGRPPRPLRRQAPGLHRRRHQAGRHAPA